MTSFDSCSRPHLAGQGLVVVVDIFWDEPVLYINQNEVRKYIYENRKSIQSRYLRNMNLKTFIFIEKSRERI
jgi:hypothetical protein